MEWLTRDIGKIPRSGKFPFQVKLLYFCTGIINRQTRTPAREEGFEINIRLSSESKVCRDIINGREIHETFPHAVWKMPEKKQLLLGETFRDTIAFGYPVELLEKFGVLGMLPEKYSKPFIMTDGIRQHVADFRKLCRQLYSPGAADQIDWVCFQLCRDIFYADAPRPEQESDAVRIKNISVWLQQHFDENIDLDDLARANGFSRASFFRKWKQVFPLSPVQYLLDLKLRTAAKLLQETDLPISQIVNEVHFSGTTAFYRRFRAAFGMMPDRWRKSQTLRSR